MMQHHNPQPRQHKKQQPFFGNELIRRLFGFILLWSCATIAWVELQFYKTNKPLSRRSDSRHHQQEQQRNEQQNAAEKIKDDNNNNDESLRRLQELGVNVTSLSPEIKRRIPSWSTILSQYYNIGPQHPSQLIPSSSMNKATKSAAAEPQPIIVGLSNCAAYRAQVPLLDRVVAPAGLFHSGTNLLVQLLQANCPRMSDVNQSSHYGTIRGKVQGLAWQVSWGKHNPAQAREDHYHIDHDIYRNTPVQVQLPVVLIRHPYDWMERMCSWSYSVYYPKTTQPHVSSSSHQSQCPWLTDDQGRWVPVLAKWGVGDQVYTSLAHLWNAWYQDYFYQQSSSSSSSSSYPRLLVRLEDLMFMPEMVISQICHCVGGVYLPDEKLHQQDDYQNRRPFRSVLFSAKSNDAGHQHVDKDKSNKNNSSTSSMMGLVDAWIQYGHIRDYANFSHRHLTKTVFDAKLLDTFHYQLN